MSIQVIMPQFGESVNEATITKWLKIKGESVQEFEPLVEVNTDKVDTEVPSPASGVLFDILIPEGATVSAGTPLAVIGQAEDSQTSLEVGQQPTAVLAVEGMAHSVTPPAAPLPPEQAAPVTERTSQSTERTSQSTERTSQSTVRTSQSTVPSPGRDHNLGFISPVVARIASQMHVDLSQVKGTGQAGRITKKDILAYLERRETGEPVARIAPPSKATPAPSQPATVPLPTISVGVPPAAPTATLGQILPHTPVRRSIAEHMLLSKHTSPHVSTIMEADLSRVIAHRQSNKEAFARDQVNLTFTAYFVAACVTALKAFPIVNSSWSEEGILLHQSINIGIATSLGEAGLIVPVIKDADRLSLLGLARAVNDLAGRARARQLKPKEVQGGTFTITNHGVSGSLFATPIINQPQSAILGVGVIQKRVVVITEYSQSSDPSHEQGGGDVIAIRPMVYLGLTFDHRILDGSIADTFLGKVVETLQNWST